MSVAVTYTSNLSVVETLDTAYLATNDKGVTISGLNSAATLNGTSTPAATKVAFGTQALTAGAATMDLTALTGTNGATVTGLNLKVRAVKLRAKSTNSNPMVIEPGDSNPYPLFGAAFKVILLAGQEMLVYLVSGGTTIESSAKVLKLTGTGTEILEYEFIFG